MAKTSLHGTDDRSARLFVTEARQASRGRHALVVLLTSTALALVALFAALALAPQSGANGSSGRQMSPADAGVLDSSGQPVGFSNDW